MSIDTERTSRARQSFASAIARAHVKSLRIVPFALIALSAATTATTARAAPEAHILRIDGRAGAAAGAPIVTTLVAIAQWRSLSDVFAPCATHAHVLDCWKSALTPGAPWSPFPFPQGNAIFTARVESEDAAARLESSEKWGDAQSKPGVGTAWIVALDASASMGARYADARAAANAVVQSMRPNDLVDVVIFDDKQVVRTSRWLGYDARNGALDVLQAQPKPLSSHGGNRPLYGMLTGIARDAMTDLALRDAPLHQAMVVLSSGVGSGDAESNAPSPAILNAYFNAGRFVKGGDEKRPLPVVALWFPTRAATASPDTSHDAGFMQSLANLEIGGAFDVMRAGDTVDATLADVRRRFDAMWIVRWRVPCVDATTQSFNLVFTDLRPAVVPDGTFAKVGIGVAPSAWPLDVDVDATMHLARTSSTPGALEVVGAFCWGRNRERAEAYLLVGDARGPRLEASDTSADRATFRLASDPRSARGGDFAVVVVDAATKRERRFGPVHIAALGADAGASKTDASSDASTDDAAHAEYRAAAPQTAGCAGCATARAPGSAWWSVVAIAIAASLRRLRKKR